MARTTQPLTNTVVDKAKQKIKNITYLDEKDLFYTSKQ